MLLGRLWSWSLVPCLGDSLIRGMFSCFEEDASWISEHGLGIDFTLETESNLLMNFGELMAQAGGCTLLGKHVVDLPCVPLQVDNVL